MARYELFKATDNVARIGGSIVSLVRYPSRLERLFGAKPRYENYHGSGTVWHRYPGGKRASTHMESLICDLLKKHIYGDARTI